MSQDSRTFQRGRTKMIKLSFYYGLSAQDTSIWVWSVINALSFLLISCKTIWGQLTREIKLCYGWTRCGQQFVCAVRLSHILTSFSAKYAPLIVRAALISASCGRKGWANQWWALTLVFLLGNKNIWKDFTSSLGSPSNSISVCAPPLELCKQVF